MKALRSQNYYNILGVTPSASSEEIRRAYELSKVTYQENSLATYSLFTDEENQEILGLISRAYETLFNSRLRREYDEFLEKLDTEDRHSEFNPSASSGSLGLMSRPHHQSEIFQPRQPFPSSGQQVSLARTSAPQEQRAPQTMPYRPEAPMSGISQPGPGSPPARDPVPVMPMPARVEFSPPEAPLENTPRNEALEEYLESVTSYNGQVLKKIRELRGLRLEDVAEKTKIRRTYLEYMEEEEFTFLPADIYVKGFVSMIAKVLDLPPDQVMSDYMKTVKR